MLRTGLGHPQGTMVGPTIRTRLPETREHLCGRKESESLEPRARCLPNVMSSDAARRSGLIRKNADDDSSEDVRRAR
jgi:hypothetical protein